MPACCCTSSISTAGSAASRATGNSFLFRYQSHAAVSWITCAFRAAGAHCAQVSRRVGSLLYLHTPHPPTPGFGFCLAAHASPSATTHRGCLWCPTSCPKLANVGPPTPDSENKNARRSSAGRDTDVQRYFFVVLGADKLAFCNGTLLAGGTLRSDNCPSRQKLIASANTRVDSCGAWNPIEFSDIEKSR
jgi:hypothetical protein